MEDRLTYEYLNPTDVGRLLGVSPTAVRRMIRNNDLEAFIMPPGRHYKVTAEAVLACVNKFGIPLTDKARQILEEKRYPRTQ